MPVLVGSRYTFSTALQDSAGRWLLTEREPFGFVAFPDNRMHTVVQGDTLFALAGRYFAPLPRACGFWWAIADFQPPSGAIVDPTLDLDVGRTLYIPSVRVLTDIILGESRREIDVSVDRSAPGVRVTSLADPNATAGTPVDLGLRILSFTYEESDVRVDKMSLELDNFDGALFDRPELLGGALLEVSWGYPGNMSPAHRVAVTKLRGFTSLTVEAHGLAVLWNDQAKTMRWTNATRSDVAHAIAASHGYDGAFLHIDDTEERFDVINQAAETDAWFLTRLAAIEHFLFAIEGGAFHFHARKNAAAPDVVLTYYADLARGDIQRLSVESDLTRRVGSVTVRGRDPMNKATLEARSNADTAPRGTLGDVLEVFDKETGDASLRPWVATESVQPSAASSLTQVKREADARFTKAESTAVVLSADVVGDPALRARAIVEIRGVPARIAGKYRVREAKHQIAGSGYAVALKLARDAVGKVPAGAPNKPQGGEHNDAQPQTDGALDWVQTFDKETGAETRESRRGHQPLGAGDPEGPQ